MAQIIYRDSNDKLKIGSDGNESEMKTVVYRADSTQRIIKRDGMFVREQLDGSSSTNLCRTN